MMSARARNVAPRPGAVHPGMLHCVRAGDRNDTSPGACVLGAGAAHNLVVLATQGAGVQLFDATSGALLNVMSATDGSAVVSSIAAPYAPPLFGGDVNGTRQTACDEAASPVLVAGDVSDGASVLPCWWFNVPALPARC